jgi:radical SAM superfamily enzyme YgiQ (UPF0313 family)
MRVVIADLKGRRGFVNKDTVVGGYGSRFRGFSWTTRWVERARKLFQNIPSIHAGYLAAIFERAGHDVLITRDEFVDADLALILSSLVDHKNEVAWAKAAKRRYGMRVGFFGAPATHMPELLQDHADFLIKGEPEGAAMRIAGGEVPSGIVASSPIGDLDSLPFPAWHLFQQPRRHAVGRSLRASYRPFPILSSRSCPEFCTYCPHRITAPYRARTAENVVAEIEEICGRYGSGYFIFRDPLFTEQRERVADIAESLLSKNLKVRFECETRLDDLDKSLLSLLRRAGLDTITFGVESVDASTLKQVGRRPIPKEHQLEIIRYCRDSGITTEAFYVLGFLTDTAESVRATIDHAIALGSTCALFKILTPFPGTPLFKQMKPLIRETDWEKFDGYTPTFAHPDLSADELMHLLGLAYTRFYVRPSFGLNYFGVGTPSQTVLQWLDDYAKRRQLADDILFFAAQPSNAEERF